MKTIVIFPYEDLAGDISQAMLSLPDSSLVRSPNPFFIPEFDTRFTATPFMACRISKLGKSVSERFAQRYYSEVTPAFCFVARNMLDRLHARGLPWTEATGFDRSLVIGDFINFSTVSAADIQLEIPGQQPETLEIPRREDFDKAIERVSDTNMIKTGDLILLPLYDSSHNIPVIDLSAGMDLRISANQKILVLAKIR